MDNTGERILKLLQKIDEGYEASEEERQELAEIREIYWSFAHIAKLPESMHMLVGLKTLDLSWNRVSDVSALDGLTSLTNLNLFNNGVSDVSALGSLTSLTSLKLSGNEVSDVSALGGLTSLTNLDLSHNKVSDISALGGLPSLTNLYLDDNKVSDITALGGLTSLINLDLGSNKVSDISALGGLTSLTSLNLGGNEVSDVSALGVLTSLTNLYLFDNGVSDVSALGGLTFLTSLSLSGNEVREISTLSGLTSLTDLFLANTAVSDISVLKKMKLLTTLDLENTKVSSLGECLNECQKLETLDLSGLILDKLPESLFTLGINYENFTPADKGINLHHTTLRTQPVSLFFQSRELIADYYAQRQIPVNETKVIFLGWEGVGKTHTIRRIKNGNRKIDEKLKETPGISITPITFEEEPVYRINFWDFGGQEIMHSMHRCFLTDRTSYIIVVSTRFGDLTGQARDWLKSVESFAGRSPVLIFINEWSEGTNYGLDERSLREEYPNIVGVVRCSAKDGEEQDFARVTEAIKRLARGSDSVGMDFPEKWENIRQRIIKEGEEHYYINLTDFRRICRENGVENEDIQGWLLEWFNDLGECFSYRLEELKSMPEQDFKVLNPEWLTNAIYIIIREMRDVASKGFVSHEGIENKLDHSDKGTLPGVGYSKEECQYVLAVMRKFLLSYEVPGKKREFIPALLPDEKPEGLQFGEAKGFISYEMKYQYLPENVIHNLMIGMYDWLDYEKCWRKGMLVRIPELQNEGLLALLDMSRGDDVLRIRIYAYGKAAPWELLQELRGRLRKINASMNLTAEDYIIIESEGERVRVDKLLNLKNRGRQSYQGELKDYAINELLGQTYGEPQVTRLEELRIRDVHTLEKEIPREEQLPMMRKALEQPEEEWLLADRSERKKVLRYLIEGCMQLQGEPKYSRETEDPRNRYLQTILTNRGLEVRDQTQYGNSPGSENAGELDLMVMKNKTVPLTIIEAVNLASVDAGNIDRHVGKLLKDYNPNGLQELFLVAYVQKSVERFPDFWKRYLDHMREGNTGEFRFVRVQERETELHFLKHAEAVYTCGGAETLVHHICVRMGD